MKDQEFFTRDVKCLVEVIVNKIGTTEEKALGIAEKVVDEMMMECVVDSIRSRWESLTLEELATMREMIQEIKAKEHGKHKRK